LSWNFDVQWSPPKVSVPLLNLVDVIFQLQGRGWIRRQVLWMAKQILKVGLGDAIDDWLLEKIQWLRRDDIMSEGIQWVRGVGV
jgi:sorting nexin-13